MTQQVINVGATPNDGTGDPLRTAWTKANANFTELYGGAGSMIINVSQALTVVPSVGTIGSASFANFIQITSDIVNAGTGYIGDIGQNYSFGGNTVFGGRFGAQNNLVHTSPTNAGNTNRNYAAFVPSVSSSAGDGGTNTGAGALGNYYALRPSATLAGGATNVNIIEGEECSVTVGAASTFRYAVGVQAVGALAAHSASFDAGFAVGGATGHVGWRFGFAFTDINGVQPFYASSTLIGAFWVGANPTVNIGIDFSNIAFTTAVLKSANFTLDNGGDITMAGAINCSQVNAGTGSLKGGALQQVTAALTLVNGANNHNLNWNNSKMRITGPSAAFAIGGFVQFGDGWKLFIYNPTAQTMTITNEDLSSTAANRIHTLTGADVVISSANGSFATLSYDGTDARWILESHQP